MVTFYLDFCLQFGKCPFTVFDYAYFTFIRCDIVLYNTKCEKTGRCVFLLNIELEYDFNKFAFVLLFDLKRIKNACILSKFQIILQNYSMTIIITLMLLNFVCLFCNKYKILKNPVLLIIYF